MSVVKVSVPTLNSKHFMESEYNITHIEHDTVESWIGLEKWKLHFS